MELLIDGELAHASSRALDRSGYRLYIPESEVNYACRQWRCDAPTGLVAGIGTKVEELALAARGRRVRFSQEGLASLSRDRGIASLLTMREQRDSQGFEVSLGGRCDLELTEQFSLGTRGWSWQDAGALDSVCRVLWIARPGWIHAGLCGSGRAAKSVADCCYEAWTFQASRGAGASLCWEAASDEIALASQRSASKAFQAVRGHWSVVPGRRRSRGS